MSTIQAIASSQFLTAMGPMYKDEAKMQSVMQYITTLREQDTPCQFSESEIMMLADEAEREYQSGQGMTSHAQLLNEIATWQA